MKARARHAECQHVDAAIALTGRRVARHRRAARLVRIPWLAPGRRARLERGDDAVGDLLVVVARRAVGSARGSPSCCAAGSVHRGVLPSWVSGTPLPPRVPADRGKGAPLARGHGPVPCGGRRRRGTGFYFVAGTVSAFPLVPGAGIAPSNAYREMSSSRVMVSDRIFNARTR